MGSRYSPGLMDTRRDLSAVFRHYLFLLTFLILSIFGAPRLRKEQPFLLDGGLHTRHSMLLLFSVEQGVRRLTLESYFCLFLLMDSSIIVHGNKGSDLSCTSCERVSVFG